VIGRVQVVDGFATGSREPFAADQIVIRGIRHKHLKKAGIRVQGSGPVMKHLRAARVEQTPEFTSPFTGLAHCFVLFARRKTGFGLLAVQ
jgi:hypothetical protein